MIQSSRKPPPNLGRGASEIDHVDLISNLCEILILVLRVRIRACVHQECHPNLGRKIPKMSRKLSKSQVHLSFILKTCSKDNELYPEAPNTKHGFKRSSNFVSCVYETSSGGSFLSQCSLNVHIRQEVLKLPHFTSDGF